MASPKFPALFLAATLSAFPAQALDLPRIGVPGFFGGGDKEAPLTPGATADCPVIVIENGTEMLRTPAGADAASVHHQVSIKKTARECIVEGDHVSIRVGVEGDAMLGPAGAPGAYGGTLRIALRRTKDDSIVSSKNYRVGATIPSGAARADFQILAEPISAPPSPKAIEEYEILIGFTQGAADAGDEKPAGKKKKGRR
ncbi:MAG: hypothetical protein CTY15_06895 [Methylocystis sp.]|nr:MAG: hypothetical protein CTY15_06895 [Methylocystis sp.]